MKMPEETRRLIARLFYERNFTKEQIIQQFSLRPKTLNDILVEFKPTK